MESPCCQLNAIIDYGVPEFGVIAFKRLEQRIQEMQPRLEKYPESFTPEHSLKNDKIIFRFYTVRKRHKVIFHYVESKDIVYIDDIWDMKMNPETLRKRIIRH